jgi:hypothetical protein
MLALLVGCGSGEDGPSGPSGNSGWTDPQRIGQSVGSVGMQVALDAQGDGVAVWQERTGTWAATVASSGTWSSAERLDAETTAHRVETAGSDFFLAWRARDGMTFTVFARRFVPGQGWVSPLRVSQAGQTDTFPDSASDPDLAVAPGGAAMAVWRQIAGGDHRIWAAHHTTAGGWGAPVLVAAASGNVSGPQVAMDDAGNATCAWLAIDGGVTMLRAARFTPADGWRPDEQLDARAVIGDLSHPPSVAMAGVGEGFVVVPSRAFRQPRGEVLTYRTVGAVWEPALIAEATATGPGDSFQVAVDADATGAATVVWLSASTGPSDVWANRFTRGTGWGMPQRLETRAPNAYTPAVAAAGGAAWAVWLQAETAGEPVELNRVWSSRITAGTWSAPEAINSAQRALPPDVDAAATGRALAAWSEGAFQSEAPWANRFVASP